jgi:hypothetical protein
MATEQKTGTRLFYSYRFRGILHFSNGVFESGSINDAIIRRVEERLNTKIKDLSQKDGLGLLEGEPNAFVYDFHPIKG